MNDDPYDKLINVNCPFKRTSQKYKKTYVCGRLCVRVSPNSYGQAWCRSCRLHFYYQVNDQETSDTRVRVQKQEAVNG